MKVYTEIRLGLMLGLAVAVFQGFAELAARAEVCKKVELTGEVSAGQEWRSPMGEGWIFRILPIEPGPHEYTGWDLVVDRARPAGYPDALLLATLPYSSINQREIGTTFGLRSQDAIGWNPRSFRFLTDPSAFLDARQRLLILQSQGGMKSALPERTGGNSLDAAALSSLLELQKHASAGEFHILDARITPGVADPAPFARPWAMAASATPHQVVPASSGKSTALGTLNWMRFSITLWLPKGWRPVSDLHGDPALCPQ